MSRPGVNYERINLGEGGSRVEPVSASDTNLCSAESFFSQLSEGITDQSIGSHSPAIAESTADHWQDQRATLGADELEEWDCEEEQQIAPYNLWWRIALAMIAITLVAAFFYLLEKRKPKQSPSNRPGEDSRDYAKLKNELWLEASALVSPLRMAGVELVPAEDCNVSVALTRRDCEEALFVISYEAVQRCFSECKVVSGRDKLVLEEQLLQKLVPANGTRIIRDECKEERRWHALLDAEEMINEEFDPDFTENGALAEAEALFCMERSRSSSGARAGATYTIDCSMISAVANQTGEYSINNKSEIPDDSDNEACADSSVDSAAADQSPAVSTDSMEKGSQMQPKGAVAGKEVHVHWKSQLEAVFAAAVGEDYEEIEARVRLCTGPRGSVDASDPGSAPDCASERPSMVDTSQEGGPVTSSKSEDPPSLAEHTTAPEIETIEASDVEEEQEEEEPSGPDKVQLTVTETGSVGRMQNGSPPAFMTTVTTTPPVRRRPCGCAGKAETTNGRRRNGDTAESSSDRDAVRSSVFEVIGARTIDEALVKMETLDAVTRVMRLAGLESSNLIFGIDYTASNKYQGELSFGGQSLHKITDGQLNPYQQVITIMGQTLSPLVKSGYIPAYGFGDVRTSDVSIFPLKENGYCRSFTEVLEVYNEVTPTVVLSGPTNFAPLIYQAMKICKEFRSYHILVIVADGQVTNERATRRAIVAACKCPLSIICVGVGDGPWDMMKIFDENLPKRPWDNFHFVEFYKITTRAKQPDLSFAMQSLLEIPDQYKKIKALGLLNFSQ